MGILRNPFVFAWWQVCSRGARTRAIKNRPYVAYAIGARVVAGLFARGANAGD